MPAKRRDVFQYAIVRVVPRVERGECLNVGVVLCAGRAGSFGHGSTSTNTAWPRSRPSWIPRSFARTSKPSSGSRPVTRARDRSPVWAERVHWLVAPASTIIQPSEVHTGFCDDPAAELDHLVATLVD